MKLFLILSLLLFGCATEKKTPFNSGKQNEAPREYVIYQIRNSKLKCLSGKVQIDYEDYKTITSKSSKKKVPAGGYIRIYIYRVKPRDANLKYFSYRLLKNGQEIKKINGRPKAAQRPSRKGFDGSYWWNADIVSLKEPIGRTDSIELIVTDKKHKGEDKFTINWRERKTIDWR